MQETSKQMILFTILFLTCIRGIEMQPATCIDNIHCPVGFFCHAMIHSCHECLSCEHFGRSPVPIENACIMSGDQCGPCLQGLYNDEGNRGAMCLSPDARSLKMLSSYICILVTCVATGVLLSLFIIYGIWNTQIINVKIVMPSCKKISPQPSDSYAMITKKDPTGLKV